MDYDFVVTKEGLVDAVLSDDLPILAHSLADSLGTRPPRGAPQDGPSTYWLDHAIKGLRARIEDRGEEPFADGNVTYMQLLDGVVEVRYDYDDPYGPYVDRVPPEDLLELLMAWRDRVMAVSPDADRRFPQGGPAIPLPGPD